ncbi:MAG: hypothetical protein GW914_00055 [Candidatus Aenigmarchaeota archaeon]|nr:hypothetical protein [Candidatus Aenigmarchaeota archaeon]
MSTSKKEESKPAEWTIRFHDNFFRDLDRLSVKNIQIFEKKKQKILESPLRQKHLRGGTNCYREPITKSIRLVYFIQGHTVWMLTIGAHDKSYETFKKRLYSLRLKYDLK